ncbi:TPA: VOC family protein, partial [Clostridioides difficile]|nr:VOC family protein [Clostridioides difficile]
MKFLNVLVVVEDIEKSKKFYYDVLGLKVICDFGENVV